MGYEWVAGLIVLMGVGVLFAGGAILSRPGWVLGWLRGSVGFTLVGLSACFAVFAVNIFNYQVQNAELPLATLSIEGQGAQSYRVVITDTKGKEQIKDIDGDLWQLNARVITWTGLPSVLGFRTGYRLENIRGRYLTLEQETASDKKFYPLSEPDLFINTWVWLENLSRLLGWIKPEHHSTHFTPLADGAIYSVLLTTTGVIIRPVNERAELAVKEWH